MVFLGCIAQINAQKLVQPCPENCADQSLQNMSSFFELFFNLLKSPLYNNDKSSVKPSGMNIEVFGYKTFQEKPYVCPKYYDV